MLFGYECMAVAGRIVARPDVFAQATLSHLGETCRNRPRLTLELSLRRRALVLSEVLSRLGKLRTRDSLRQVAASVAQARNLTFG